MVTTPTSCSSCLASLYPAGARHHHPVPGPLLTCSRAAPMSSVRTGFCCRATWHRGSNTRSWPRPSALIGEWRHAVLFSLELADVTLLSTGYSLVLWGILLLSPMYSLYYSSSCCWFSAAHVFSHSYMKGEYNIIFFNMKTQSPPTQITTWFH